MPAAGTRWTLSLYVCSQRHASISSMTDWPGIKLITTHQEESIAQMQSNSLDRETLRSTLALFIDPNDPINHPIGIANIASMLISLNTVSVDKYCKWQGTNEGL